MRTENYDPARHHARHEEHHREPEFDADAFDEAFGEELARIGDELTGDHAELANMTPSEAWADLPPECLTQEAADALPPSKLKSYQQDWHAAICLRFRKPLIDIERRRHGVSQVPWRWFAAFAVLMIVSHMLANVFAGLFCAVATIMSVRRIKGKDLK